MVKRMKTPKLQGTSLLLIWATITAGQRTWLDDSCACPTNTLVDTHWISLTPLTMWSACKDWTDEDGDDVGCYSALQERTIECLHGPKSDYENKEAQSLYRCLQYRRCIAGANSCDGFWGQWSNNGPCDCATMTRTQSRHCYKKTDQDSVKQSTFSIHCIGSGGYFEQNRTVGCSQERDCLVTTTKAIEDNPPTKRLPERPTRRAPQTFGINVTSRTNVEDRIESRDYTVIISVVSVSVAFIATMIMAAACIIKRKNVPYKDSAVTRETQPPQSSEAYCGESQPSHYTTNSLYEQCSAEEESICSPSFDGNAKPRSAVGRGRSVTTTDIHQSWESSSVVENHSRRATTGRVGQSTLNLPSPTTCDPPGISPPHTIEPYSIGVDNLHVDDENIYCSIEDTSRSRT